MNRKTLCSHKDFIVFDDDLSVSIDGVVLLRAKRTRFAGDARYGVTAPKRLFKHAVQRNRAKRLLRIYASANEDLLSPNLDYVFFANEGLLDAGRERGIAGLREAIIQINDIYEKSI